MKTIFLICISSFFITGCGIVKAFSQESQEETTLKTAVVIKSADTNISINELLFIASVMRAAHQNTSELIHYKTGIDPFIQSYSGNWFPRVTYFADGRCINSELSLMYQYSKIDVSKSKNLDYKSLSSKYHESLNVGNDWGQLIYDIIYMGASSSTFYRGK
jgi:hypothetical protein